jgi:hypothetical protein
LLTNEEKANVNGALLRPHVESQYPRQPREPNIFIAYGRNLAAGKTLLFGHRAQHPVHSSWDTNSR